MPETGHMRHKATHAKSQIDAQAPMPAMLGSAAVFEVGV